MARILIVDDDEPTRNLIKQVLTPQGHAFELAANGYEAVEIMRKKTIDLAIVDRKMPGMDGVELVQYIRQNRKTTGMKVLMCTGSSVTKDIDEAYNAGADDYLLKPLSFPALLGKVSKTLAGA